MKECRQFNIDRYENEHPDFKRVKGSKNEEILKWADKKRYITLQKFERILYYTEFDQEVALMWAAKEEVL